MTHTIYNTKAIVLGRVASNEADNILWLLTRDLGLIVASAKSVRKETAKMRPYLQTLGTLAISMVKGRHTWRIVGAEQIDSQNVFKTQLAVITFAKLSNFIKRMTVPNADIGLYDLMFNVRQELLRCESKEQVELIEIMAMAKILVSLGYMPESKLSKYKISKRMLIADINKAINASHM